VSGGHNDRNPEVTSAFTSQGSAVLHTADHGAVSVTIAEGEVRVKGFHALK
jgi:hypothetical protein